MCICVYMYIYIYMYRAAGLLLIVVLVRPLNTPELMCGCGPGANEGTVAAKRRYANTTAEKRCLVSLQPRQ